MNSLTGFGTKPLNSLFRMAVLAGVEASVRLHVDRGDDVNARDGNGMTPLMLAASKNKAAICAFLLSHGADLGLTDSGGRDAMALARASGALDAVAAMEPFASKVDLGVVCEPIGFSDPGGASFPHESAIHAADEIRSVDENDGMEDISGWEAEEDRPAPTTDGALVDLEIARHEAISSHVPVDPAEDWGDFDAFLPEEAASLPKIGEDTWRERASSILRMALREGSLPERGIHAMFDGDEESERSFKEGLLRVVLADLGAETDERFDLPESNGLWLERPDDEDDVMETLAHYEDLLACRNDPSRHYMRELPKVGKLLTVAEEQALGQAMEEGLAAAIDTLAAWPRGVAAFLDASLKVGKGAAEPEFDSDSIGTEPVAEDGDDDEGVELAFQEKAKAVGMLAHMAGKGGDGEGLLRSALHAAKPSPDFLFKIGESPRTQDSSQTTAFMAALGRHGKAKERFVRANLRLVIAFVRRFSAYGLPFDDLVQEGNIGLMKAADRFEWRRGNKFSTYATWWIRQSVTRALADKVHTIRMPVHVHDLSLRMAKEAELLQAIEGRPVSRSEVAARMSMPLAKVEALMARWEEPVSLHEPDWKGVAPIDFLEDESRLGDPYALAERSSLLATLGRLLEHLPAKESEMITMRFGLDGEDPRTLEDVGIHYGVTRERIRQKESATLKELAKAIHSDPLRTFLDGPASAPRLVMADPGLLDDLPTQRKEGKPQTIRRAASKIVEDDADEALADDWGGIETPARDSLIASAPQELQPAADRGNGGNATYRVIEMAKAAGAVVLDRREYGGDVVIQLVSEESRHRAVVRKLLSAGFEQSGGMEFRK